MYKELLDKIKKYQYITIYRHKRPDGDATFSCSALKEFIKDNFKDKEVKLCGIETYDKLPVFEKVGDEFIEESLAIILDCANPGRVDDDRFRFAKERVIIDHHPTSDILENDLYIVDTKTAAACELLTKILYSDDFKTYHLNQKVCEYLCLGILTDSNCFSTSNTTSDTLYYASKLVKDGNLQIADLCEYIFGYTYDDYQKITKLREYLKIKDGVGYIVLNENDLDKIGFSYDEAKNHVNEFSSIQELKIWAIFVYNPKSSLYDASIRSRRKYIINKTCERYNGGGHNNACGVKSLSEEMLNNLLKDLTQIANNK